MLNYASSETPFIDLKERRKLLASGIAPTFRLSLTAHTFQPQSCRKGVWTHFMMALIFQLTSYNKGLVIAFLYRVYPLHAVDFLLYFRNCPPVGNSLPASIIASLSLVNASQGRQYRVGCLRACKLHWRLQRDSNPRSLP